MSDDFAAKLRSLSFPRKTGQTERKPVQNELTGGVAGYHDVHWDGRQDATVFAPAVSTKGEVPDAHGA